MGAVPKFPGLGDRLAARLRARGYTKGDRLDVLRFALDFRYNPASIYAWLKGATPLYEALERLATDCQCELGWLLLGDRRLDPERPQILTRVTKKGRYAKAISGGSDAPTPLPRPADGERTASYQTWRRRASAWWARSAAALELTLPARAMHLA